MLTQLAAMGPAYAPNQVSGLVTPRPPLTRWNRATATAVCTLTDARFQVVLRADDRRWNTRMAAEPISRPISSSSGEAKNRPRTSGSSLIETVWASRLIWMCRTHASVAAKAAASSYHGSRRDVCSGGRDRNGRPTSTASARSPTAMARTRPACRSTRGTTHRRGAGALSSMLICTPPLLQDGTAGCDIESHPAVFTRPGQAADRAGSADGSAGQPQRSAAHIRADQVAAAHIRDVEGAPAPMRAEKFPSASGTHGAEVQLPPFQAWPAKWSAL